MNNSPYKESKKPFLMACFVLLFMLICGLCFTRSLQVKQLKGEIGLFKAKVEGLEAEVANLGNKLLEGNGIIANDTIFIDDLLAGYDRSKPLKRCFVATKNNKAVWYYSQKECK